MREITEIFCNAPTVGQLYVAISGNVVAGRHADWVSRYTRQLDKQGQSQQAIHFYREGLRLDANDRAASARLASHQTKIKPKPHPQPQHLLLIALTKIR
jgi:predicted TPR repeat methyltransferase